MDSFKKQDIVQFSFFWGIAFIVVPLILLLFSFIRPSFSFGWQDIKSVWIFVLPFFVLAFLHNFFIYPFLKKKKYTIYAILLAILIAIWAVWCFVIAHHAPGGKPGGPLGLPPELAPAPPEELVEDRNVPDSLLLESDQATYHDMQPEGAAVEPHAFGGPHDEKFRAPLPPETLKFILGLMVIGLSLGIQAYLRLRQKEKENAVLEKEVIRSQLDALRFQINPHFFMNTMNNIQALILIDPDSAVTSLDHLSKMMRQTIYQHDSAVIPLSDEISFLENYVELMKLRCDKFVTIETKFPESSADALIPPMSLATIMENAFKHGVITGKSSFVKLSVDLKDGRIISRCSNSVHPGLDNHGLGIGKENVKKRLALIYHDDYSISSEEREGEYEVILDVPAKVEV